MTDTPLLDPEDELVIAAKLAALEPPEPIEDAADLPDDVRDGDADDRTPEDI